MERFLTVFSILILTATSTLAQTPTDKAQAVLTKAVQALGGNRYLNVNTIVARGRFTQIREGMNSGSQTFLDIIVYPDKERTEFKNGKVKTVQVNVGSTGWFYQGENESIADQNERQIADFTQGMAFSVDNLLRGSWKGKAEVSYIGKRDAGIGKVSEVVRLAYSTGETVEFEFGGDGLPIKSSYKRINSDGEEVKEEDHYAQFIEFSGVRFPLVVDHYIGGVQVSRINYESVEFNRAVPASVFAKPTDAKVLRKDLRF